MVGNTGKDGLKYSTGINLSGFDPAAIVSQFDDIDVRNGSQKFHFSRAGNSALDKNGNVKEIAPTTEVAVQAKKAATKSATVKSVFSSPLVVAGGIGLIGVIGLVIILHAKK